MLVDLWWWWLTSSRVWSRLGSWPLASGLAEALPGWAPWLEGPPALVALALDLLRSWSRVELLLLLALLGAGAYVQAELLQRRWNAAVAANPQAPGSLTRRDWWLSLPALLARWLTLPFWGSLVLARWIHRRFSAWLHRRRTRPAATVDGAPSAPADSDEPKPPPPPPYLAATLGPSYALAGLWLAGLYLLLGLAAPLLAAATGSDGGLGLLASRPEWGGHIPLVHHPQVAALVATGWCLVFWVTLARLVRSFYGHRLARDLREARDDPATLPVWRHLFAVRDLLAPAEPYRGWAVPLVALALPGLVWTWHTLGDGRDGSIGMTPLDFAVGWTLWLSWVVHLRLRGEERRAEVAPRPVPAPIEAAGWQVVLDDLRERLQVAEPRPCEPPRPIEPLTPGPTAGSAAGSPLLAELLVGLDPAGGPPTLTALQHRELARLGPMGEIGAAAREETPGLELTASGLEAGHAGGTDEERHRIVLAPEGWGKTTLGFLAAVDQALVRTRSTLVVVRHAADARRFEEIFRPRLERSTLRWNIRLRRAGADLATDLARGIVPDVVLTDLHALVTDILADGEGHGRWLRRLGLVVVDDAESFAGPVEVHAQLAFRRLQVVLRQLGGRSDAVASPPPRMLVLGRDTMFQADRWMAELCGITAGVWRETDDLATAHGRQRAGQRARGEVADEAGGPGSDTSGANVEPQGEPQGESQGGPQGEPSGQDTVLAGHHQRFYRLADFRTSYGESITLAELVASCERHAVPWHFRWCGDGRRHLGVEGLDLGDHPEWRVEAARACVVILSGAWSEVRRELRMLRRAGAHFSRFRHGDGMAHGVGGSEPIALVTQVDGDEEMALTERDAGADLANWLDRLPLPLLRPPGGSAVMAHLAADLTQRWIEVGDLVEVYGGGVTDPLRRLARADLLLAESRFEIARDRREHEERLHVRGLFGGLEASSGDESGAVALPGDDEASALLPAPVDQVELTARPLAVIDRTTMLRLLEVDAEAATLAFYPGRLFTAPGGRYAIVGRVGEGGVSPAEPSPGRPSAGRPSPGDLLAEPVLVSEVSSPRRRLRLRSVTGSQAARVPTFGPDPFHFGPCPVALALELAEVRAEHQATCRVDPVSGTVRQRHVATPAGLGQGTSAAPLVTEVLRLYPNPAGTEGDGPMAPPLTFAAARLVTAAMHRVLPSLYRRGAEALGLGLDLADDDPAPDHRLGPREGFVFFDLGRGGTGAVRSLARDGVERLLRLVRRVLERVLDHRRLLVLHDPWPDPGLLEAEAPDDAETLARQDLERRRTALAWLDSRLRPEGGPTVRAPGTAYGWDSEPGEGDVFDLGRVWWSPTGGVSDLLWVKHRWRRADGREASLDLGFDRASAEASRWLTEESEVLAPLLAAHRRQLGEGAEDDGVIEGVPLPVIFEGTDGPTTAQLSDPETLAAYHALVSAVAAHQRPMLGPLARKLRQESPGDDPDTLATWLARCVQGIPYSLPLALRHGLRPPVSTLLFRRGDCDSKSLLLALLLEGCGLDAGLFVSFDEGHALAAVALPAPSTETPADGEPAGPVIWAEGAGATFQPIESTVYSPVGRAPITRPETWVFLPLVELRSTAPVAPGVIPSDRAESESLP